VVKNLPANAGDARVAGSVPGLEVFLGRNGNPLQYSCLESSIDREACLNTKGSLLHAVCSDIFYFIYF